MNPEFTELIKAANTWDWSVYNGTKPRAWIRPSESAAEFQLQEQVRGEGEGTLQQLWLLLMVP